MYYHVTLSSNVDSIMRYGLVPSIGHRSVDCGEDVARVYLFGSLEDVDVALGSWFGDEFGDDVSLVLLGVDSSSVVLGDVSYEYVCYSVISPDCISFIGFV